MNSPLIPRPVHGLADYVYAPTMAAAPEFFGFAHNEKAAGISRMIGAGVLASTVLTRAEWGLAKLMPYKTHLTLDFTAGLAVLAMPWLAGFGRDNRARNTFLVMGAISVGASLLSGLFGGAKEMPLPASSSHSTVIPATMAA